eukprot:2493861-Ditylum_brightwellii.AAC.1
MACSQHSHQAFGPISFPPLSFLPARRVNAYVDVRLKAGEDELCMVSLQRHDSVSGNILVRDNFGGSASSKAYWIQRKVSKLTYGSVRVGYVLRPKHSTSNEGYIINNAWE